MKYYVADYNGILTDLKKKLAGHLTLPREADVWIVWQDCQGSYADLIRAQKQLGINKPVYCVQHGRAATSDYAAPNRFPLRADKFLCWGKSDYDRMASLGYQDKVHIVGCPLNAKIFAKVAHPEKVILFVPVSTGKEEPENIAVYYELMKLKYHNAQTIVLDNRKQLKDSWGFDKKAGVGFNELAKNFDVVAKLLPWHERKLYHGNTVVGYQDNPANNEILFKLLRNVDLVVGLDEGTTEIFAYGHDVPVVIADGFRYRQHAPNGRDYTVIEPYKTKAAVHCELQQLSEVISYELEHPDHLKKERAEVAELELGTSMGNATDNILKFVREDAAKTLIHSR